VHKWIFDAHGLAALTQAAQELNFDIDEVIDAMTALAEAGELECPPTVIRECRAVGGPSDKGLTWARAAAGHFRGCSVSWAVVEEVVTRCPEMVDVDDVDESPQVEVLALALARQRDGWDVTVVTAQLVDTPLRMALATAASAVSVDYVTPTDFIAKLLLL
jgi:hypothetical protein